ncbi:nucleotide exchange factor GrpE [Streptosporangium sandarakinum]|uniref:Protein GrpE n=1 Tax=Streptosporangium sandarakinum TaxID=1260955 RepID=A0A852V196_9ACTN|nr:nucleotide exchange factor GrpE [Streptosporangium sandarakinum]NYF41766.1 molecular chaperone GrpE [Streptosporangium sandarakinum]
MSDPLEWEGTAAGPPAGPPAEPSEGQTTDRAADRAAGQGADRSAGRAGGPATGAETGAEAAAEAEAAGLRDRVAELEDRWKRALADLDNLRKRVSRDAERVRLEEQVRAAGEWLPVLDNLERALEHAEGDPASLAEGLRAVLQQGLTVLAHLGFPRRDDTWETFDPARHEAVAAVPREDVPAGTVVAVVRPGYGDGERQLRPAQVVVSKAE